MSYEEEAELACKGGAEAFRFGDGKIPAKEIVSTGRALKEICKKYKALFIISGRPDLALACEADGVHLENDDIPLEFARQILGPRRLVASSVSSLGQALAAAQEGADLLTVGPLFPASSEGAVGLGCIPLIKKRVRIPVLGAGGVTLDTVAEVMASGADGVMVSRAVCGAKDVAQAAVEMKKKITEVIL